MTRQASFAGGELAPELHGRTDIPKHAESVRTLRNWFVTQHGAVKNRPGTKYIDALKDASRPARLMAFAFSDEQSLLLVLNGGVVRFYSDGELVTSGGVAYEVAHGYADADLPRLKYAQAGDIVTICHKDYPPAELRRYANDDWTLADVDFVPRANFGSNLAYDVYGTAMTATVGGTASWDNAKAYKAGQYAVADAVGTDADKTGLIFMATQRSTNIQPGIAASVNFWVLAIDTSRPARKWSHAITIFWKDTSGVEHETLKRATTEQELGIASDRPARMTWTAPGAVAGLDYKVTGYGIYKGRGGVYGRIGRADADDTAFIDDGIEPDYTQQPPVGENPFKVADGTNTDTTYSYPAGVGYFEGRRVFFRSDAKPSTIWGSRADDIAIFDPPGVEVTADEAYTHTLVGQDLQEIRGLCSAGALLLFTVSSEWVCRGDFNGAPISPLAFDHKDASHNGSGWLDPLLAGKGVLYAQTQGNSVHDFYPGADGYDGEQVSALASHLFQSHTVLEWGYAKVPWALVWMVRDDGVLLALSYDRKIGRAAWSQQRLADGAGDDAVVENLCVVPEDTESGVYVVVQRPLTDGVGGVTYQRYIERFASRLLPLDADGDEDVRKSVFLDSAVVFDGRNTGGTTTKVAGSSKDTQYAMTASAGIFAATDLEDAIVYDPDGDAVRARIVAYIAADQVTVELENDLTAAQTQAWVTVGTTNWAFARRSLSLPHLLDAASSKLVADTSTLGVLADGYVANDWERSGSNVVLVRPAVDAVVGLKIAEADVELLDLGGDKSKLVRKVVAELVSGSRGLWAGPDADHLSPWKQRQVSDGYEPVALYTGPAEIPIKGSTNKNGRILVRQVDPLPCTIVAITREVEVTRD